MTTSTRSRRIDWIRSPRLDPRAHQVLSAIAPESSDPMRAMLRVASRALWCGARDVRC